VLSTPYLDLEVSWKGLIGWSVGCLGGCRLFLFLGVSYLLVSLDVKSLDQLISHSPEK